LREKEKRKEKEKKKKRKRKKKERKKKRKEKKRKEKRLALKNPSCSADWAPSEPAPMALASKRKLVPDGSTWNLRRKMKN